MGGVPRSRWARVGLLMFLTYLIAYVDRNNLSMAIPGIVKDFGIKSTDAGVLLSAFFWGYVITQIPGGYIASRYNAKKVIVTASILWGIFALLTGLVQSFSEMIVIRFLLGLVEGVVLPAFTVMTGQWFPNNERSKANSFFQLALPVSGFVMAPTAGWLIAATDWHLMFIIQSIPAFIMALVFGVFVGNKPETDKRLSEAERDYLITKLENEEKKIPVRGNLLSAILNGRILLLGMIYLLWITGFWSFGSWLPTQMKELSKVGITGIGLLTAIPYLVAIISMYVNAHFADKNGKRQLHVAIPLFIGGLALIGNHFVSSSNLTVHMILLMIAAIGIYAPFGPWWAWSMENTPRRYLGAAMGFINFAGNWGGIIGPIIVGMAKESTGQVESGFYLIGFIVLLGGLITYIVSALSNRVVKARNSISPIGPHQ